MMVSPPIDKSTRSCHVFDNCGSVQLVIARIDDIKRYFFQEWNDMRGIAIHGQPCSINPVAIHDKP
jgi:hypothetical protein